MRRVLNRNDSTLVGPVAAISVPMLVVTQPYSWLFCALLGCRKLRRRHNSALMRPSFNGEEKWVHKGPTGVLVRCQDECLGCSDIRVWSCEQCRSSTVRFPCQKVHSTSSYITAAAEVGLETWTRFIQAHVLLSRDQDCSRSLRVVSERLNPDTACQAFCVLGTGEVKQNFRARFLDSYLRKFSPAVDSIPAAISFYPS